MLAKMWERILEKAKKNSREVFRDILMDEKLKWVIRSRTKRVWEAPTKELS